MDKTFGFQNLEIYQLGKALVIECYRVTRQFPSDEKFALTQQMNRAAVSIPSNIAEGYSRFSVKEKSHFLNIAYGSLMELICQFEIAKELGYLTSEDLSSFVNSSTGLAVKISNFRKSINGVSNGVAGK